MLNRPTAFALSLCASILLTACPPPSISTDVSGPELTLDVESPSRSFQVQACADFDPRDELGGEVNLSVDLSTAEGVTAEVAMQWSLLDEVGGRSPVDITVALPTEDNSFFSNNYVNDEGWSEVDASWCMPTGVLYFEHLEGGAVTVDWNVEFRIEGPDDRGSERRMRIVIEELIAE